MNTDKYHVVNGTSYHIDTPLLVINALESARVSRTRIRIFYGDTETGKDWGEEHHVIGTIGHSMGPVKIPILLNSVRSLGGPGILDNSIVKVMIVADKRVVYQHPQYNLGTLTIKTSDPKGEYPYEVYRDGENIANFE